MGVGAYRDLIARAFPSDIPPLYGVALAWGESRNRPELVNPESGSAGLFQFTPRTARALGLSDRDVLDPWDSARAAGRLISTIIREYRAIIPIEWEKEAFATVVTMGWNCGYSRKAGTARVMLAMQQAGIPITPEGISETAMRIPGVSPYLAGRPVTWARRVAKLYLLMQARDRS